MDTIFRHFISRGDDDFRRLANASWFIQSIPIEEFSADEQLFWKYIEYSEKLNAPIKSKYFDLWLHTELRAALMSLNCRVIGCESLNYNDPVAFETAVTTTTRVMQDTFSRLEATPSDIADFNVDAAVYFNTKRNARLTESLSEIYNKLNDTNDAVYASEFAADTINNINSIYDKSKLEILGETTMNGKMEFVTDCGLEAIDSDSDGLYTTQLFGVEAQPGTGKTRFVIGTYCYRAATLHKKNVCFISLEQTKEEIESMFLAQHVFNMFNIQLSDKLIRNGRYPKELKPQVEAARYDLFESGKYGKIICLEKSFQVRTFISELRTIDRLQGPFDLIAIDYMGLIRGDGDGKGKKDLTLADRVNDAYEFFKAYVRKARKAGIAIGQFNQAGIEAGEKDKAITPDMAQGGIAVYRHTDYNIAISRTEAMKLQQKVRFSQPKVRASNGFGTFIADTRLGFCHFRQVVQKQV